jgi:hypothetical protein
MQSPPSLVGTFWSKQIGAAITVVFCDVSSVEAIRGGALGAEIVGPSELSDRDRYVKRSFAGLAFRRDDLARANFADVIRPYS